MNAISRPPYGLAKTLAVVSKVSLMRRQGAWSTSAPSCCRLRSDGRFHPIKVFSSKQRLRKILFFSGAKPGSAVKVSGKTN